MQIAPIPYGENPTAKPRTALQREASRRNGARSKGPKTLEGKARSSRNACRQILIMPAMSEPAFQQHFMDFAREIAGPDADPAELAIAMRIAAAQIDVQRARSAVLALLSVVGLHDFSTDRKALSRAAAITRYEGRIFARRNKAIRELDAWRRAKNLRRVQNDKTNLTLAGQLAVVLALDESGSGVTSGQRSGPLTERTRPMMPDGSKTNLTAEKRAVVRAELSSRCNRAEAGMKKRTRAIPASRWKVMRTGESSGARIHSCKTNSSWWACIRPGRGHYICAVIPGIARGYRSAAPGNNRVFRLLH
jgi:hypothetical protein